MCPKALAAQKALAAHGAAHGAAPDDPAHRTVWQNVGPDLLTVGRGIAHLPAVAGTGLKALAFGAGNMAQKYGDGIMEGDYYLDSLVDHGADRARDLAAKEGYDDAANRAEAREKTAAQPLMDTFSALTPGTLKDVTAAAADAAGGQPGEAKRVLESIVPNTEQAFHDAPVQTSLNGLVVLGGAGRVLSKAGDLAGAGRVGAGLSKAGEAAQSAASGGPVGRAVRAGVGRGAARAASAGLKRLSPEKQAAFARGVNAARAAQASQRQRAGGRPPRPAPAQEAGRQRSAADVERVEEQYNAWKRATKTEAQENILRQRRLLPAGARPAPAARASASPETSGSHPIANKNSVLSLAKAKSTGELGLSDDAKEAIKSLENIKKNPLGEINSQPNHNHYAAARLEAQGIVVATKPGKIAGTTKAVSHIGELQEAYNGLVRVHNTLKDEEDYPQDNLTFEGIDVLDKRLSEVDRLRDNLKGFLNSIGHGKTSKKSGVFSKPHSF